jgi:[acyl-carrier-protein] S-malonyltransferase
VAIAFLFPGQGAQAVGMGRQLYDTLPEVRKLFDEAASVLGYSLIAACTEGPAERLNTTVISQPAIFVSSLAALESLRLSDPEIVASCSGSAGLSLGEYTALVFSGAISFADALRVVHRRGEAMQAASDASAGAMVSVLGMEREPLEQLCEELSAGRALRVANLLCPGNLVVSGALQACEALERVAPERGAMKTIRLAVAGAFHTELMRPADQTLAAALNDVPILTPRLPVWSNVDALPHTDPAEIRSLLVRQVVEPVLWEQSVRNLLDAGFDRFYEIGPGRVLAGLLKRVRRQVDCRNVAA